jgi:hypothetical protein
MGISSIGLAAQSLVNQASPSSANGAGRVSHQSAQASASGASASSGVKDGDGDHGQEGVGGKVNVLA